MRWSRRRCFSSCACALFGTFVVQARETSAIAAAEAATATMARLRGEMGEDAVAAGDARRAFADLQVRNLRKEVAFM